MVKRKKYYDLVILVPVFNNYIGLLNTVKSISVTSKKNILIVIVDDGSDENQTVREEDLNFGFDIKILTLSENQGVEKALNIGLKIIFDNYEFDFFARIDSGDKCINGRFDKQFYRFDSDPDLMFLGTCAELVSESGEKLYIIEHAENYENIKKRMFINNNFVHPTLMIRGEFLKSAGYYSGDYPAAEDYEYCFRMLKMGKGENLNEVLLRKEYSLKSISVSRYKRQVLSRIKIIWRFREFSIYFFYGLIRNIVLLFLPHKFIERCKRIIG